MEGDIPLNRKSVAETFGPLSLLPSSFFLLLPSTSPHPPSTSWVSWGEGPGPGAQFSVFHLCTHVLSGLPNRGPAALPLCPGMLGGFHQREKCWWSQIHIMSTSSWKPGILIFTHLISSVMFLNEISSQRGSELLLCGPQSPNKYHGVCLNYLEGKGSRSVWIVDAAVQFPSQTWPQGSNIFKDLETDFTG